MCRSLITEEVIPVIVAELGENWHVGLHQHQAVLVVVIIRLSIGPVKPVNSGVSVLPGPFSLVMVGVVTTLIIAILRIFSIFN